MRPFAALTCLVLLFPCLGCNSVMVQQPFGEPVGDAEREQLTGVWELGEGGERLKVAQTKAGVLKAGLLEWDEEKERFIVNNVELQATHLGNDRFVLMQVTEGPKKSDTWTFVRYERVEAKKLHVFGVDAKTFRAGVESGTLAGTVKQEKRTFRVTIESSRRDIEAFIKETGVDACFVKDPLVVRWRAPR